jgi:hypothetical protein
VERIKKPPEGGGWWAKGSWIDAQDSRQPQAFFGVKYPQKKKRQK